MTRAGIACIAIGAGCAPTAFGQTFNELAQARGIVYTPTQIQTHGQGVAFVDLDGDGDPDVIATGAGNERLGLWENDGNGFFTNREPTSGVGQMSTTAGVCAADMDRDGDLDVYISRWNAAGKLLRNDGDFTFTDVTIAAGMSQTAQGAGCSWGDYDGDGWIDLYVANWGGANLLYRNLGDGTFVDVAPVLGVDDDQPTFQGSFIDFDHDGDPDIYLATDRGSLCETIGYTNKLFENVDGTFVDITEESGTEACVDAMSIAIGDFDRNGFIDFYCTNIPEGNALLLNQGDSTFDEAAVDAGVTVNITGWGAAFFDYDNDANLDLYVCNSQQPNSLFRHDGTFPATNVAAGEGCALGGPSYGVATADIDGDGDIDMLVQNRQEPLRLYVNTLGESKHWIQLDAFGPFGDRWGIGTRLEVRAGDITQVRQVFAGSNYKGQDDLVQHIGLDAVDVIDEIVATWPDGASRSITGLATDQRWAIVHPHRLGDGDLDGDRDLDDVVRLVECIGPVTRGCEALDFDGDGDVDESDVKAFIAAYDGPVEDCDGDRVPDFIQIIDGAEDDNRNGRLDVCEPLIGDIDGDDDIDIIDLALMLSVWEQPDEPADLNRSGLVDVDDLIILIGNWL